MKSQSLVAGAHYDHLGLGWPETRDARPGRWSLFNSIVYTGKKIYTGRLLPDE
jgi:hypothetical protein